MSAKPESDPYYSVRDTVQETVDRIQSNHKKFLSLLKTVDTSSNNEFKDIRKSKCFFPFAVAQSFDTLTLSQMIDLRGDIRTVDEQLKFLKGALDAIEKNRANYSYIKDGELAGRKKFVEQSSNNVQSKPPSHSPAIVQMCDIIALSQM